LIGELLYRGGEGLTGRYGKKKIIKPIYVFEQGSEKDKYIYKNQ
jgi:hypothetical protein